MTRRLTIATCLIVLLGTACRSVTPGAPVSTEPGAASAVAAPPTASGSRPPAGCELGTGVAEYAYPGLREFVGEFRSLSRGVAVAEVVRVGELQYATESGERPSCDEIRATRGVFSIGRMVEVRVLTPAGGAVKPPAGGFVTRCGRGLPAPRTASRRVSRRRRHTSRRCSGSCRSPDTAPANGDR